MFGAFQPSCLQTVDQLFGTFDQILFIVFVEKVRDGIYCSCAECNERLTVVFQACSLYKRSIVRIAFEWL